MVFSLEGDSATDYNKQFSDIHTVVQSLGSKIENSGSSMTFCPSFFSGLPADDSASWLESFKAWVEFNGWKDPLKIFNAMKLRLNGSALEWSKSLTASHKSNSKILYRAFTDHFQNLHPNWLLEQ